MKSTTIRRSSLSKEKNIVLEALKKYKASDFEYAPNVYVRPNETEHEKKAELDLLWRNFNASEMVAREKAPKVFIATGIAAGILLFAGFTMTAIFAHRVTSENVAASEFGVTHAVSENVDGQNKIYVVQSGDTIEKILIRFYGQYSKLSEAGLLKANNISNPNKLSVGQELIIPMNKI